MRLRNYLVLVALAGVLLVLPGCATKSSSGGHTATGVWGYVVSADDAALQVNGTASANEVTVDRVKAPGDAWIVVHVNNGGKPGMRVGLQHVSAGETADVRVALDKVEGDSLIVAVHADKGTPGEFDFSMDDPTRSPDRPYFVNRKELAVVVNVD